MFADLKVKIDYVHTAVAAYEGNLAFVVMTGSASCGKRICDVIKSYADEHSVVRHTVLRHSHMEAFYLTPILPETIIKT